MRALAILLAMLVCGAALAQWPSKPIRIIVGYAPGGTADVSARVIGEAAGRALGQTFIIENRAGAAGGIAVEAVARAAPDGYTLLVAPDSSLFQPLLKPSIPYRVEKSFLPITNLTSQPLVIVANPSLGVTTLAGLVAMAKASSTPLHYATPSIAGTQNIVAELFFRTAGVRLQNIPYKGGGQAVQDLVSGQLMVGVLGSAPVLPHGQSGRLLLLAVSTKVRSVSMPEVPTITESGYPGFDMTQWFGILAPIATPAEIVARLSTEFQKALADPGVKQRLANSGLEPVGGSSAEFAQRIRDESVTWARAAAEFGIKLE